MDKTNNTENNFRNNRITLRSGAQITFFGEFIISKVNGHVNGWSAQAPEGTSHPWIDPTEIVAVEWL